MTSLIRTVCGYPAIRLHGNKTDGQTLATFSIKEITIFLTKKVSLTKKDIEWHKCKVKL